MQRWRTTFARLASAFAALALFVALPWGSTIGVTAPEAGLNAASPELSRAAPSNPRAAAVARASEPAPPEPTPAEPVRSNLAPLPALAHLAAQEEGVPPEKGSVPEDLESAPGIVPATAAAAETPAVAGMVAVPQDEAAEPARVSPYAPEQRQRAVFARRAPSRSVSETGDRETTGATRLRRPPRPKSVVRGPSIRATRAEPFSLPDVLRRGG